MQLTDRAAPVKVDVDALHIMVSCEYGATSKPSFTCLYINML
jgi:hypothetical protein